MSRQITGVVVSDKNNKTIVVKVEMSKTHPLYRKKYTRDQKFMAHDQSNEASVGDTVVIEESRPLSARKRFMLLKIVEKSSARFQEADAAADVPLEEIQQKQKPAEPKKPNGQKTTSKKTGDKSTNEAKK